MVKGYSDMYDALRTKKSKGKESDRQIIRRYLKEHLKPFEVIGSKKGIKVDFGSINPQTNCKDAVFIKLVRMNLYVSNVDGTLIKDETNMPFSVSVADPECAAKLLNFLKEYVLDALHSRLRRFSSWVDITQDDIEQLEN